MDIVTFSSIPLLSEFSIALTEPTYRRLLILAIAAVLTTGCRTVSNLLRTVQALVSGHASSFHRVLSRRRFNSWILARLLIGYILNHFVPDGPVQLAGDDTVDQHRGPHVFGKACHRDAVRSSHSHLIHRWGHKWVVVAILVKFPFAFRCWALPVLVALYRSREDNKKSGIRHKTPCELMRQLLAVLIHWFPEKTFVFAGDGGFGTHPLARFCYRHRSRVTLISRFYPTANLYEAPPAVGRRRIGRPRVRGKKLPAPQAVVARSRRIKLSVAWYGGKRRRVEVVSGTGHWYKAGHPLVPVRWIYVHDCSGTHRDDYFFTTDLTMNPQAIIEGFTQRWSIETTFQEMRAYLKVDTTRGWCRSTVLRAAPLLFGLYSVIALLYAELPARWRRQAGVAWTGKATITYSDAITVVRRWLWEDWILPHHDQQGLFKNIPLSLRITLLRALAPAA